MLQGGVFRARIRRNRAEVLSLLLLLALTLVFYRKISFSNSILAGFDTFTYFYPQESYLAESLRQGHLPLWNPYLFTGVPFLANMQTAVFYPFNLMFLVFPIPRAYAYSVILHVFMAGSFMFLLCRRSLKLSAAAAFIGAAAFMFSGFFNSLVGHINQLQAAAWIPLLFLLCDLAMDRRSIRIAAIAGIALALQFMAGHAQEFYLTVFGLCLFVFLKLITNGERSHQSETEDEHQDEPVEGDQTNGAWHPAWTLGLFGLGLAIAVGLSAVQLLPSFELSSLSIRAGGMTYKEAVSFSLPPWLALKTFLPVFGDEQPYSEWLGYVGVFSATLAMLAVAAGRRRTFFWFAIAVSLVALFFAFGQYNPLYPLAYKLVPGLKLFRVPARWIYLYTFGMAILAAIGADCLRERARSVAARAAVVRFMIVLLGIGLAFYFFYLLTRNTLPFEFPGRGTRVIWIALAASAVAIIVISLIWRFDLRWMAATIVVFELFAASQGLELNQTTLAEGYSLMQPSIARLLSDKGVYRVLPVSDNAYEPGDIQETRNMLRSTFTEKEIYDYIVASKWKETLQPNLPLRYGIASLDGYDGGMLPLQSFMELKKLFPLREKQSPDGRLREELTAIPDADLLGMLNVKYILMDRVHDAWVDGVYYDLGLSRDLDVKSSKFDLDTLPSFETTSIGVVSHLSDAAKLKDNETVAQVVVTDVQGVEHSFPLRAGVETSEGKFAEANSAGGVAHKQAKKAKSWKDNPDAWDYVGKLTFPSPIFPKRIEVRYVGESSSLTLRGISLIDDRNHTDAPVAISPSLEIVHLGDVKIYRNKDVWPRAFVVQPKQKAPNSAAPTSSPGWQTINIDQAGIKSGAAVAATRSADTANIISYAPERVEVKTSLSAKGFLVLTDSYYPGWRVFVDGQEQPILQANKFFKAVELGSGDHDVQFVFEPQTLKLGALVSALSVVVALAMIILGGQRRES